MYNKITGIPSLVTLTTLALTLTLSACGGGSDDGPSRLDQINGSSSSSTGGSNSSEPNTVDVQELGYGSGDNFEPGVIGVGIGDAILSAGGTTTLTVNIVSGTGDLVTEAVTVTFNSPCIAANTAELTLPDGTAANSITTANGEASLSYTAKGCVGEDKVTATSSFEEASLSAQTTITVESDTVQSIAFVDATPAVISLKGTGGQETSSVRFRVLGGTDAPIKDECVTFSLDTTQGGLKLAPSKCNTTDSSDTVSGKTNSEGYVSATVQAGNIATPVRVTAITSNRISTQSSGLAVGTGLPDQNSVSLSLTDTAPVGWQYDGITSEVTMRMADAFNNPVPDGTAVSFTTSGGSIGPNCTTINGECSVTWKSQEPRPVFDGYSIEETINGDGLVTSVVPQCPTAVECRSGRAQILATAVGNESFNDSNGNGLFDGNPTDVFTFANHCTWNVPPSYASTGTDSCDDLSEAYLDKNFNGIRDDDEYFNDFDQNGSYTTGNQVYDGKLCNADDASCGPAPSLLNVRDDAVIVMACDSPYWMPDDRLPGQPTQAIEIAAGASVTIPMLLADCNGNGMPAGTTLTVNTATASNVTAVVSPDTPLGMSQEPTWITVYIKAGDDATKEPAGAVILEITAPTFGGEVTTSTGIAVTGPTP